MIAAAITVGLGWTGFYAPPLLCGHRTGHPK